MSDMDDDEQVLKKIAFESRRRAYVYVRSFTKILQSHWIELCSYFWNQCTNYLLCCTQYDYEEEEDYQYEEEDADYSDGDEMCLDTSMVDADVSSSCDPVVRSEKDILEKSQVHGYGQLCFLDL